MAVLLSKGVSTICYCWPFLDISQGYKIYFHFSLNVFNFITIIIQHVSARPVCYMELIVRNSYVFFKKKSMQTTIAQIRMCMRTV